MGRWLASLTVCLIGVAGLYVATDGFRAITAEGARRLQVAEQQPIMPVFTLSDWQGAAVRLPDRRHDLTLIGFIYATCPTVCQAAGADFARLRDRLEAAGFADRVRVISVSFDPEQDTPAVLDAYAATHGADGMAWVVAAAAPEDLAGLLAAYGVQVIPDMWDGFEHNAAIHAVDGEGRLFAVLDIDDIDGALNLAANRL